MIKTHLFAALATVLIPVGVVALLMWQVPFICGGRGQATSYRWVCLLPAMTIATAPVVALILPLGFALLRRLPRHPIALATISGAITQCVYWGFAVFTLEPHYLDVFASDVLAIPQPFIAGAIPGLIYGLALRLTPLR